jgi:hypothetical protein
MYFMCASIIKSNARCPNRHSAKRLFTLVHALGFHLPLGEQARCVFTPEPMA